MKQRLQKKHAAKYGEKIEPKKSEIIKEITPKFKTICLTMIVKNESKNMIRLLETLKNILDFICIEDTGSTDNTINIINNWAEENSIACTVHYNEFKNFEHNRTHSFNIAKQTYNSDYYLLSDADFKWEISPHFNKNTLNKQKYLVNQDNGHIVYSNIRMLCRSIDWKCIGVTHEYWTEPYGQKVTRGSLDDLKILDLEDGGCKSNKFQRDKTLLEEGLKNEKDIFLKMRYKFYYAQTLKDMSLYEQSIFWYHERIKDRDWSEEVFYSYFMIATCYECLAFSHTKIISDIENNNVDEKRYTQISETLQSMTLQDIYEKSLLYYSKAFEYNFKAFQYRPIRADSLYRYAILCRMFGLTDLHYKIVEIGQEIKFPDDSLFVSKLAHTVGFNHEYLLLHQNQNPQHTISILKNLQLNKNLLTEHMLTDIRIIYKNIMKSDFD